MDSAKAITHVSLCTGYGGIDLGLKQVLPNMRTIAYGEIEAYACANLVSKIEKGFLDVAPIWTDIKTFPWNNFCGKVGILSGGYPCQPFSNAGSRKGTDDPRHLWPFIANGIRLMRPQLCFFENVEGHISLGLREVVSELETIGYRTTWGIFSAREVGAPHQRKRIFIMGYTNNYGRIATEISQSINERTLSRQTQSQATRESEGSSSGQRRFEFLACSREREREIWPTPTSSMSKGSSINSLTRKNGKSRAKDRLDHAILITMINYPTPQVADSRACLTGTQNQVMLTHVIGGQLNPVWVEWLMGVPIGWTDCDYSETELCQQQPK